MFVIEKFINDLRAKDEVWEKARDKWLNEATEYGYRYESDYQKKYPRPSSQIKKYVGVFFTTLAALGILTLMGLFVYGELTKPKPPKSPEAAKSEKNCNKFNKEDHVRVQYGDYADKTGRIVGGCEDTQAYQVKLDEGQKASVPGDGHAEEVNVAGRIIGVDRSDNLVVIEDKKE